MPRPHNKSLGQLQMRISTCLPVWLMLITFTALKSHSHSSYITPINTVNIPTCLCNMPTHFIHNCQQAWNHICKQTHRDGAARGGDVNLDDHFNPKLLSDSRQTVWWQLVQFVPQKYQTGTTGCVSEEATHASPVFKLSHDNKTACAPGDCGAHSSSQQLWCFRQHRRLDFRSELSK